MHASDDLGKGRMKERERETFRKILVHVQPSHHLGCTIMKGRMDSNRAKNEYGPRRVMAERG